MMTGMTVVRVVTAAAVTKDDRGNADQKMATAKVNGIMRGPSDRETCHKRWAAFRYFKGVNHCAVYLIEGIDVTIPVR